MSNPLLPFVRKSLGPQFLPRLKRMALGLAADFWKDGTENILAFDFGFLKKSTHAPARTAPLTSPANTGVKAETKTLDATAKPKTQNLWHAAPGEISEKMFGAFCVTPGDTVITEKLISPLGVTKDMSMLDLSAGLGGRLRKTVKETKTFITGLEPDAAIAARGMELSVKAGLAKRASVTHYNPEELKIERKYDCVIARETFYRVSNKDALFKMIADNLKPGGQVAFTDYIVDAENRNQPAVQFWQANEKGAAPLSLAETVEAWSRVGVKLRVHEDLSVFYKAEVRNGLTRLSGFLGSDITPDAETRTALLRRVEIWMRRIAAMDQGMKFYRFYGSK